MDRRRKSRKPGPARRIHGPIERYFGPCGSRGPPAIAVRKPRHRWCDGEDRAGFFGTESLQRMAPGAIRWSSAGQKLPPYRSLVHRYVGRISTNDLVATPNAHIEEPIGD
jgi:hypothetical protein